MTITDIENFLHENRESLTYLDYQRIVGAMTPAASYEHDNYGQLVIYTDLDCEGLYKEQKFVSVDWDRVLEEN